MKKVRELLVQLAGFNVQLWVENNKLYFNDVAGVLSPELKNQIRKLKSEIISYLQTLNLDGQKTINRVEDRDLYPLSTSQQSLWFLQKLYPENHAYKMLFAFQIQGKLCKKTLAKSIECIIQHHESYRACFIQFDGSIHQKIIPFAEINFNLEEDDFYYVDPIDREKIIKKTHEEELNKSFNLEAAPLLNCKLITFSDDNHVLFINQHHIISDGWSIDILLKELNELYTHFQKKSAYTYSSSSVRYVDYCIWQNKWFESDAAQKQIIYWQTQLLSCPPLKFPLDYSRPEKQTFIGDNFSYEIPQDLFVKLQNLTQQLNTTLYVILLSIFDILLAHYTGQDDIVIGGTIANRSNPQLEMIVGYLINVLVIRSNVGSDPTFISFIERNKKIIFDAHENQDIPFEKLINKLNIPREQNINPLFQILFEFENMEDSFPIGDLQLTRCSIGQKTAKFDLTLFASVSKNGIKITFNYNTAIFNPATIRSLQQHYLAILTAIIDDPNRKIMSLSLLTPEEKQAFVQHIKKTPASPRDNRPVHLWFEEQVLTTPNSIALIFKNQKITYQELNIKANQIAHYLRKHGVTSETIVAIAMEKSLEMIICLLGILKAGGAYLPLELTYPAERLEYILNDAGGNFLLTQRLFLDKFKNYKGHVFIIDEHWGAINQEQIINCDFVSNLDHLVYVIYTSGSTGNPKGVMIKHKNLIHYLRYASETYHFKLSALLHSSIAFDMSITTIFLPLISGKSLYILPDDKKLDSFIDVILQNNIDFIKLTPTHLRTFANQLTNNILDNYKGSIIIGGENLLEKDLQVLFKAAPHAAIYNEYGPTEATVGCSVFKADPNKLFSSGSVSIGQPIDNTQIYILDQYFNILPKGIIGELYIGGDGLARGYLNLPEITKERFITNPFVENERLYKTGDLARYLSDGNIEFIGRSDNQIKIRGFRIELSEIECVLNKHEMVSKSVVLSQTDITGHIRLIAYIVHCNTVLNISVCEDHIVALREYLVTKLPDYMIPHEIIFIEKIPLNANGKLDIEALRNVVSVSISSTDKYVSPRTNTEKILAELWSEILKIEYSQLGIHDNFFELGGDSILIIQIVARARQLNLYLNPQQMFQYQTIAKLADIIQKDSIDDISAEQNNVVGSINLTPIQRWYFAHHPPQPSYYNQSILFDVKDKLDPKIVILAVGQLIMHHDVLRTRFIYDPITKNWSQYNNDIKHLSDTYGFTYWELTQKDDASQTDFIIKNNTKLQQELNIESGPTMNIALYNLGKQQKLFIVIHHLVFDGVSWRIFLEDFQTCYSYLSRNEKSLLSEKTTSYKRWAELINIYSQSDTPRQEINYWLGQLTEHSNQDCGNTDINNYRNSEHVKIKLENSFTEKLLKKVPKAFNTQINEILLSALLLSYAKWKNQASDESELIIDLEGHGREYIVDKINLSRTIGWFTTMFPLKLHTISISDLSILIKSVKEQVRRVPQHGINYSILKYLCDDNQIKTNLAKVKNRDILFNYLGQFDAQPADLLSISTDQFKGSDISPDLIREHQIAINSIIIQGEMSVDFTYCNRIHNAQEIRNLAKLYIDALKEIINYCSAYETTSYTPADFGLTDISLQYWEKIIAKLSQQYKEELKPIHHFVQDIYPLSPLQEGLLFQNLYNPVSDNYFVQVYFTIHAKLDIFLFKKAWELIIDQYEILRTGFIFQEGGKPLQFVLKTVLVKWEILDWSDVDDSNHDELLKSYLLNDRRHSFDLSVPPLIRLSLLKLSNNRYYFIFSNHHILIDGWSCFLIFNSLFKTYVKLVQNEMPAIPNTKPYRNYINWLQSQNISNAENYWRALLKNFTTPTRFQNISIDQSGQDEFTYQLPLAISSLFKKFSSKYKLTINTILQGAWGIILSHFSGESDVVFGVTVSGRSVEIAEIEHMVGLFINTLPIRIQINADETVLDYLQKVQVQAVASRQYEYTQLAKIQSWSEISGGVGLFDTLLVFENYPVQNDTSNHDVIEIKNINALERTNYPITVVASHRETLSFKIIYDKHSFSKQRIETIFESLLTLLANIIEYPQKPVTRLPLLSQQMYNKLIVEWNSTFRDSYNTCTPHIFEKRVIQHPHKIAISCNGVDLTYLQVNERANQLAHKLKLYSVQADDLIIFLLDRSNNYLIAMLGVWKAGGAFIPLNPQHPNEKNKRVLEQTSCRVLLVDDIYLENAKYLCSAPEKIIKLSSVFDENLPTQNLPPQSQLHHLAYIIFTSGSTGIPKGAMVQHDGMANHLYAKTSDLNMTSEDVVAQIATQVFDVSVWQYMAVLLVGGKVVVFTEENAWDPPLLLPAMIDAQVTIFESVPTHMLAILEELERYPTQYDLSKLKWFMMNGEPLHPNLCKRWFELYPQVPMINAYGPTECSDDVTHFKLYEAPPEHWHYVPISGTLPNMQLYVLDKYLNPVPLGVKGELYIGGVGVGRGYLNDSEKTAKSFIANPFSDKANARLYKTGDIVRYSETGELEFISRVDNQVKIRGFRIELGEIESRLNRHPEVLEGVVTCHVITEGNKHLVGYVTSKNGDAISVNSLRRFLLETLPDYMVPSHFVMLNKFPLTNSGKIDRNALPAPLASDLIAKELYEAPASEEEKILAKIWADILRLDPEYLGIHHDFFELGGDSIISIQIVARARQAGLKISVRDVFLHHTIAGLAMVARENKFKKQKPSVANQTKLISKINSSNTSTERKDFSLSDFPLLEITQYEFIQVLDRIQNKLQTSSNSLKNELIDIYPLSPLQEGLLFHKLHRPDSDAYLVQLTINLSGEIDPDKLRQAWQLVINRHDIGRTGFIYDVASKPLQYVLRKADILWSYKEWQEYTSEEFKQHLEIFLSNDRSLNFDLEQPSLSRFALFRGHASKYILVWSFHHILFDGWCVPLLLKEVLKTYDQLLKNEQPLLVSTDLYKKYIGWIISQDIHVTKSYWKQLLHGFTETTRLDIDLSKSLKIIKEPFYQQNESLLSKEFSDEIRLFSQKQKVTVNTILQTVWGFLLASYSRSDDVVFGTTVSGRTADFDGIEKMIGLCINTIPLRIKIVSGIQVNELLLSVQNQALESRQHEYTSLSQIKTWSEIDKAHALFESIFIFENYPTDESIKDSHKIKVNKIKAKEVVENPLTVTVAMYDNNIYLAFDYDKNRFAPEAINRLSYQFQALLKYLIGNPQQDITKIPIISDQEQHQQLNEWNNTFIDYQYNSCLHQLFEQQVSQYSNRIAINFGAKILTYQQLNAEANKLANFLIRNVPQNNSSVIAAICMDRSIEMIVAVIASSKANITYLPIDPEYPVARIRYMLEDSQAHILLTQTHLMKRLSDCTGQSSTPKIIAIDQLQYENESIENISMPVQYNDIAYIMYTSGSTGQPKGVLNTHHGAVNHMYWMRDYFKIQPQDCTILLTSFSFDTSLDEYWLPLISGARLCIAPVDAHHDLLELVNIIKTDEVTILQFVPALLEAVLEQPEIEDCHLVRLVLSGGSALSKTLQQKVFEKLNVDLYNLYGPTETSIDALVWHCQKNDPRQIVPIGKPIANMKAYLLDKYLRLIPQGVIGELHLSGVNVGRGYLNRPDLTQEKFITNIYDPDNLANNILYKTGDLVRWTEEGVIEYCGRIDDQLKIRGLRIEPSEIENILLQYSKIKQVVVMGKIDQNDQLQLVVYYVLLEEYSSTVDEFIAFLKPLVPEYIIPRLWKELPELPLLPNGKIDKNSLSKLSFENEQGDSLYVPPRSETEKLLCKIWSDVLKIDPTTLSVTDNYFSLGGDSIISIQICSRVRQTGLHITLRQLFDYPTIAELSQILNKNISLKKESLDQKQYAPLTPIQQQFFTEIVHERSRYNQAYLFETSNTANPWFIKLSLLQVIKHHDALRLEFHQNNNEWIQKLRDINDENNLLHYETIDLTQNISKDASLLIEEHNDRLQGVLKLQGPLVSAAYYWCGNDRPARLFIAIHHLVVDGVSWRIILDDLAWYYHHQMQNSSKSEHQLSNKTTSYIEWANCLYHHSNSAQVKQELDYWQTQTLPPEKLQKSILMDYPENIIRKEELNTYVSVKHFIINFTADETKAILKEIPAVYGTRINDCLLAALTLAFNQFSLQESLLIDLESHGREEFSADIDLSQTIGWFTSIFPMKLVLPYDIHIKQGIQSIKEQLKLIPHNGIGFGLLKYLSQDITICEKIKIQEKPLILFNYLGQFSSAIDTSSNSLTFFPATEGVGNSLNKLNKREHLIEINGQVNIDKLQFTWSYSQHFHNHETIEKLAHAFKTHLLKLLNQDSSPPPAAIAHNPSFISPKQEVEYFALAPLQKGIFFHRLYSPDDDNYVVQTIFHLKGDINTSAWQMAWQHLIDKYDILRSGFALNNNGEPHQFVGANLQLPWRFIDWQTLTDEQRAEQLQNLILQDRKQNFNFEKPPLTRCILIKHSNSDYYFIWSCHHIIIDGWSSSNLLNEVMKFYQIYVQGQIPPIEKVLPYKMFIEWLQKQDQDSAKSYWSTLLKDVKPSLLCIKYLDCDKTISKQNEIKLTLSKSETKKIVSFTQAQRITLNTLLQAAWSYLLAKYSNSNDIVYGVVATCRPLDINGIEKMVGLFINTFPVRVILNPQQTFTQLINAIHKQLIASREYDYYDLHKIQGFSKLSDSGLFDHLFVFENYPLTDFREINSDDKINFELTAIQSIEKAHYNFSVIAEAHEEISITIIYDEKYYASFYLAQLIKHYKNIINAIISNPDATLDSMNLLSHDEYKKIIFDWNNTSTSIPNNTTIQELFAKTVQNYTDNTALIYQNKKLSYKELDRLSSQLACYLQTKGVSSGILVVIYIERSFEMIISVLAVLKAGGAYIPVDPQHSKNRLEDVLNDSKATLLLTKTKQFDTLSLQYNFIPIIAVDDYLSSVKNIFTEDLTKGTADDLAYIIYTSGTSGVPKGVMIRQRSLVNTVLGVSRVLGITDKDIILNFFSLSFDGSLVEILCGLLNGAAVCIPTFEQVIPSELLIDHLREQKITLLTITPSALQLLPITELPHLKTIVVAGETGSLELAKRWSLNFRFINGYGPTEATICTTIGQYDPSCQQFHIGKPIDNVKVYVLDQWQQPTPIGVIGELYIGGAGVGIGYLNQPVLTENKFIDSPLRLPRSELNASKLYRSGDFVRWSSDGNLNYIGRNDDQVKIRGFRIELGEIESKLLQHKAVKQAAIICNTDNSTLLAFVVMQDNKNLDTTTIRRFLAAQLPSYMVPNKFYVIERLPLTSNNKTDKQALLAMADKISTSENAHNISLQHESVSNYETIISRIWCEVLGLETVDVNTNFYDAGGHSLAAVQVYYKLKIHFQDRIRVIDLFHYTTIRDLAIFLANQYKKPSRSTTSTLLNRDAEQDIAVIGFSGRFSGAKNLNEFWQNLIDGVESIHHFSDEELVHRGITEPLISDPHFVKASGEVAGIDQFDARFFDYSAFEADITDPNHRIFMEVSYEALEHAGYTPSKYNGQIGVFAGMTDSTYYSKHVATNLQIVKTVGLWQASIATNAQFLANKIAYKLNLTGPCLNINTACSTSLTAIAVASEYLLAHKCDMALAGGSSLLLPDEVGHIYQEGGISSKDGYCRAFDAKASGTVGGSGSAVVILKKLSNAIKDGDTIYAVIKGFATNNDGANKIGFTAPSIEGQSACIKAAYDMTNIDITTISYLEAHGTATQVGDPIEITALQNVFAHANTPYKCAIGSVKTNIGHADSAAGIAGFLKVVFCLYNKKLVPSLHYIQNNPEIDFAKSPFYVHTTTQTWERQNNAIPLRAGVSSFGIGGSNAHVIVEEAPQTMTEITLMPYYLFILSAKTSSALTKKIADMLFFMQSAEDTSEQHLANITFTLQQGRRDFAHRSAFICSSFSDAINKLKSTSSISFNMIEANELPAVVFLFPGQGTQYINMAYDLYCEEPFFKAAVDIGCTEANRYLNIDVLRILFGGKDNNEINQTIYAQPILFIIEYALAKLFIHWGIQPVAMIGHGLGEYVAACIAGVMTLNEAIRLVALRGVSAQKQPLGDIIEFKSALDEISWNKPSIPYISNLTSDWIKLSEISSEYWCNHLCNTIDFFSSVQKLQKFKNVIYLEIGAGETLSTIIRNNLTLECNIITTLPSAKTATLNNSMRTVIEAIAKLWLSGVTIYWNHFTDQKVRQRIALPTYPFERNRHWINASMQGKNKQQYFLQSSTILPAMNNHYERDQSYGLYQAPKNALESKIAQIWEGVFGIKSIGTQDNFFSLGGDSLLAMRLTAALQKDLQTTFAADIFYKAPTISQLAQLITSLGANDIPNLIVDIQTKGEKSPIFCIHPGGGTVFCYTALSKYLGLWPFYAIQDISLYNKDKQYACIEMMATDYLQAILKIQNNGPYYLMGWSFGGVVALEIAHQLQNMGQEVNQVIMIDSFPGDCIYKLVQTDSEYVNYLIPSSTSAPIDSENIRIMMECHGQLLQKYQPKCYLGQTTLIKADHSSIRYEAIFRMPDNGWKNYLPNLNIYSSAGDHDHMLSEPCVQTLAMIIKKILERESTNTSKQYETVE